MDPKQIAQNLIDARTAVGLSRSEAAAELGLSLSSITMYELGERIPRDPVKVRMAELYKTTVTALFYA